LTTSVRKPEGRQATFLFFSEQSSGSANLSLCPTILPSFCMMWFFYVFRVSFLSRDAFFSSFIFVVPLLDPGLVLSSRYSVPNTTPLCALSFEPLIEDPPFCYSHTFQLACEPYGVNFPYPLPFFAFFCLVPSQIVIPSGPIQSLPRLCFLIYHPPSF